MNPGDHLRELADTIDAEYARVQIVLDAMRRFAKLDTDVYPTKAERQLAKTIKATAIKTLKDAGVPVNE